MIKNNLHKMCGILFFALVLTVFYCESAYAANGDVFGKLSNLGGSLGIGLARSGYLIAGIALIGFSVAAIFNKISWKTLAYIMMSTFILTLLMGGAIYKFLGADSADYGASAAKFNGVAGTAGITGSTDDNKVPKSH